MTFHSSASSLARAARALSLSCPIFLVISLHMKASATLVTLAGATAVSIVNNEAHKKRQLFAIHGEPLESGRLRAFAQVVGAELKQFLFEGSTKAYL